MSDNAVEYKGGKLYGIPQKLIDDNKPPYMNRNIDFELENQVVPLRGSEVINFIADKTKDNRTKTYAVEYAKDGVLIKGFIDGKLVDSGIVKFNRKDKLDVN